MKKQLVILLVFLMAFSNAAFASAAFGTVESDNTKVQNSSNLLKRTSFDKKKVLQPSIDKNQNVRVIVELEGQSAIEYATENNVLYKELSESTKNFLETEALQKQDSVKKAIASERITMKELNKFTTVANGFAAEVKFGDIEKIEQLSGVKSVYLSNEYQRPEPIVDMETSHGFIQSQQTWGDAEYKGEGTIIAVIDSGVDPSHKDFIITDINAHPDYLTQEEVESIMAEHNFTGKYFTEKVPFGYNYYDKNNEVRDLGPDATMHGMHVAGTTAANGSAHGGLDGVAPEAQVLGMKVFSNDPNYGSTWTDIYVKAIDDAIKLGADVVNMSLGSTGAFVREDALDNTTITRAVENGIVVAVSAGNSNHIGDGYGNPLAKNPDIGVVGSPGLSTDSLQVAATGNEWYLYETPFTVAKEVATEPTPEATPERTVREVIIDKDGNKKEVERQVVTENTVEQPAPTTVDALGFGADGWFKKFGTNELELVTLGGKLGTPEDYAGVDVKGKIVLVKRGAYSFLAKTDWAAEQGAIGIIVYTHDDNATFHKNQGGWSVPFMKISNVSGTAIEALFDENTTSLKLTVSNDPARGYKAHEDAEVGKMTSFTSWGTTPSLDLKPEISAPGGHILSTLNNDTYGQMSGTSMASPHVAGGSALVIQHLKATYTNEELSNEARSRFAKVLLMNTAKTITDVYGQPFSPRRQGAGMMQTYSAVKTPVTVVAQTTNEAKVELKDFTSQTVNFTLVASNHSDADVTYTVDTSVLTDAIRTVSGIEYNSLIAGNMNADVAVTVGGVTTNDVTVPANGTAEFTVTIDLTNASVPTVTFEGNNAVFGELPLRSDIFVEGFVTLSEKVEGDTVSTTPVLSVPYVGFYGEWDNPDILDGDPALGESTYYNLYNIYRTSFWKNWTRFTDEYAFMQPNANGEYSISPENGDGWNDIIDPLPTFLRNAWEVQFNVLDSDGNVIRKLKQEREVRKNFFNAGRGSSFSSKAGRIWDGTVKYASVEDGLYYYEIKAVIDYDNAEWQSYKYPVWVDNTAPALDVTFDEAMNALTWTVEENGSGVKAYDILVNGKSILTAPLSASTTSYTLPEAYKNSFITVEVIDHAYNFNQDQVVVGDEEMPVITISSPAPWSTFNTLEVPVYGLVEDGTAVTEVKVNGSVVPVEYNEESNAYYYSTIISFPTDGVKEVFVEATDAQGNNISISRTTFVDSTKATITHNNEVPAYVDHTVSTFDLNVTLEDNYREMTLYVDDNYAYGIEFDYPLVMDGHTYNYTETLNLVEGLNTFILTLTDLGGNVTTDEVNIYKLAQGEAIPTAEITDVTVANGEYVSTNRPAQISATSSEEITWAVSVTSPSGVVTELESTKGTIYTATFTPGEFAENGVYTVTATGTNGAEQEVGVQTTTFTVYNYETVIKSVQVLNAQGNAQSTFSNNGVAYIKASVENLEQFDVSPMIIIQVLDENNRVAGKAFLTMDRLYAAGSNGLGMQLPVNGLEAGTYSVEVFVWTGWDMIPMAAASKGSVTFQVTE